MNIEYLGYILEIARQKSINRAAKSLFITQPSLSSILRKIENEIGYSIFTRTSAGINPTVQGEQFLLSAEKAYTEYLKMKRVPSSARRDDSLSVSSAYSSLLSNIFFSFKREFPLSHPNIDIFSEATIYQNLQNVASNLTRLYIGYFFRSEQSLYESFCEKHDLQVEIIKENLPILAVMSPSHELASRDKIFYSDIHRYPIVTYGDLDHEENSSVMGIKNAMDIQVINDRGTYYDAIRIGGYLSVSLKFATGEAERNGCVCKPIADIDDCYIAAYFIQRGYTLSAREHAFTAYAKRRLDEFLSEDAAPPPAP